jgi:hypothetical protein
MIMRTALAWMVCLAALASPGFSTAKTVAGLANPLDNTGGSARAVAMGSAFVGVADDSSALLWNPAGLAGLQNTELALHHNSWLAGIVQETAVIGVPLGMWGGLGLSGNYVGYGSLPGYDDTGVQLADYSANRYGFGLGWGKEFLKGLSAGISVKGTMQTFAGDSYSGLSTDLGALWSPSPDLRLGLAYSGLGTTIDGHSPASALRVGGSYRLNLARSNQLLLAASGALEPRGVNRVQVGGEDVLYSLLALRAGYQFSLANNQINGISGLTLGAGFLYRGFTLDYAYLPYGDLGTAQRVSAGYKFGGAR